MQKGDDDSQTCLFGTFVVFLCSCVSFVFVKRYHHINLACVRGRPLPRPRRGVRTLCGEVCQVRGEGDELRREHTAAACRTADAMFAELHALI